MLYLVAHSFLKWAKKIQIFFVLIVTTDALIFSRYMLSISGFLVREKIVYMDHMRLV